MTFSRRGEEEREADKHTGRERERERVLVSKIVNPALLKSIPFTQHRTVMSKVRPSQTPEAMVWQCKNVIPSEHRK